MMHKIRKFLDKHVFRYGNYDDLLIICSGVTSLAIIKSMHITNYYTIIFLGLVMLFKRVFHYVFAEYLIPLIELRKDLKKTEAHS